MAPSKSQGSRRAAKPQHTRDRVLKRKREVEDIEALSKVVDEVEVNPSEPLESFSQLPLSQPTKSGLESSHFKKLTPIQAHAIPVSLKGKDVLGSAKTGSGKTLAFIVPVLDNLYRRRWTEFDGLGALILSPTRELAIQIFDVLRKVGRNHTFSAGLVIGGKSLQEESERLGRMNILVATPGRMLQHLDQNADLDIGNLQMLVLDEADRIMDMGFQHTVDAIVDHLPPHRQTLLFSATQTKKVSDLARLSLKNPEFISVQEESATATPSKLAQNYVVTPVAQKLDTLWSFIRSNTKKKIIVFFSSGKQVRFVYEAFRHLQPGIPLLHLHGRQKQSARLDITTRFSKTKSACLFSTDVAARGLDFPAIDWVVQADCPEDADTYIHRVGRTARYNSAGRAVLFLDPSEKEGMLAALEKKNVSGVEQIHVREKKMQNTIQNQLQNMCFKDPELKYLGQKAFVSYVRSVYIQKEKSIFDVKQLDLEAYAASLGLPGAPRVKFVRGDDVKKIKNMPRALAAMEKEGSDDSDDGEETTSKKDKEKEKEKQVRTKYDRMFERRNQDVLAEHYTKMINDGDDTTLNPTTADADEDDDFMAVKTRYDVDDDRLGSNPQAHPSKPDLDSDSDSESGSDTSSKDASESIEPPTSTTRPLAPSEPQTKKSILLSNSSTAVPLIIDSKRREKMLKSKKALLKYKGSGTHVVFSDDENDNSGHAKVHYEDEDAFKARGDAEEQRVRFVTVEKEKAREADVVDREVARQKRREKKIKRKERERELAAEGLRDEDGDGDEGEEAGVQLIPYEDEEKGEEKQEKRKRKWFEDPDSDEEEDNNPKKTKAKKRSRQVEVEPQEPQTLEDLEALASGLLAR